MISCSKEIGRVNIVKPSTIDSIHYGETSIEISGESTVSFWADMDMEYDGILYLSFAIEIYKDYQLIYNERYNALNTSIIYREKKTLLKGHTRWSYLGKLGNYKIMNPGNYLIRARLLTNGNQSLKLHKSELIIKQ